MKTKFDSYTINVKKDKIINVNTEHCECTLALSGNVEIGLEIDTHTWRADWLAEATFSNQEERIKWKLQTVYNHIYYKDGVEHNTVKGVWIKNHKSTLKTQWTLRF